MIDMDQRANNETAAIETIKPDKLEPPPDAIEPVMEDPLEQNQLIRGPGGSAKAIERKTPPSNQDFAIAFERVVEVGGSDPEFALGAPNPSYPEFPVPEPYANSMDVDDEPLMDLEPLEENFDNQRSL